MLEAELNLFDILRNLMFSLGVLAPECIKTSVQRFNLPCVRRYSCELWELKNKEFAKGRVCRWRKPCSNILDVETWAHDLSIATRNP